MSKNKQLEKDILQSSIKEIEEKKELRIYFSLEVTNPSNATTILRCVAQGEIAERIQSELQENDIVEVRGYLRNEKSYSLVPDKKENRQILTKVTNFTKLNIKFEEIDKKNSNQVRLIGKIITDFKAPEERTNPELLTLLTFKIEVPRERNPFPLFFCRVQGELTTDFVQHLNKGDIIILEGFLQAKKIVERGETNTFNPLNGFTRIFKNTKETDFTKPKGANLTEE
nr:11831_t:CDS:2 [Entrophospora candida]